jgi:hypothetical protein
MINRPNQGSFARVPMENTSHCLSQKFTALFMLVFGLLVLVFSVLPLNTVLKNILGFLKDM